MNNTCTPTGLTVSKQQAPPIDLYSIPPLEWITMEEGVRFYADSAIAGFYLTDTGTGWKVRRYEESQYSAEHVFGTIEEAKRVCNDIHVSNIVKYLKRVQP